ncbi:PPOX class F420-dependent oxidoreductase [Streptomyces sp. NPDC006997]|uniref:PPOX class F420-dependent oxidoreductase n=1 Tax=Streptomyces sp. NPDC006997 TaxID=3155356 RepID=UPI0033EA8705
MDSNDAALELRAFVKPYAALLTTYKRDGTGVGTPVNLAVDGDHGYFRTPGTAGKVKRLRHTQEVTLAPCTVRGRPTGPPVRARARRLTPGSPEDRRAARLLRRDHPVLQGLVVPLVHRLWRTGTVHYEIRTVTDNPPT